MFAGLREESGEIFVMSENGVIKVRSFNRKPEEDRWNQEEFAGIQGLPWEPVPGRAHVEVKSHFTIPEDDNVIIKEPESKELKPRRIYITRRDVSDEKYGMTPGCKGCEAANRGLVGIHNERCRQRIEEEIRKKDPARYDRVLEKLVKHEVSKEESDPSSCSASATQGLAVARVTRSFSTRI